MTGTTGRRTLACTEVGAAVGGAALLTGSWALVARRDDVPAAEARAFVRINALPDSWWPIIWPPMQVGSLVGSIVVVGTTALVTRRRGVAAGAFIASQGAYWAAKVVKHRVRRDRPQQLLPVVVVRERTTGLGYLSGHAAVSFALATALAPELPGAWRLAPFALATGTAFGRVYAGAHLPLDIAGGVGLGVLCGIAGRRALHAVTTR